MTSTELGYLSGVTSNIQDQLNGKVSKEILWKYDFSTGMTFAAQEIDLTDIVGNTVYDRIEIETLNSYEPNTYASIVGYTGSSSFNIQCGIDMVYPYTTNAWAMWYVRGITAFFNINRCLIKISFNDCYGAYVNNVNTTTPITLNNRLIPFIIYGVKDMTANISD